MTDDGQNENTTTHTVTLGNSLSIGNHRGESMARYRGHVSYSEKIARMKIRTCNCGQKLRGTKILCNDCMDGKEGFDKRLAE